MAQNSLTTGGATTVEAQIIEGLTTQAAAARPAAAAAAARSTGQCFPPLLRAPDFSLDPLRQRQR